MVTCEPGKGHCVVTTVLNERAVCPYELFRLNQYSVKFFVVAFQHT